MVLVDRAHQGHGDVIELTSRPPGIADGVLPATSQRVDLVDEEEDGLAACCLRKHPLDILASRANPAGQQLWSGYVFEVQPELTSGRSCQECFPCPTRSVQKDSISHQPVAFVLFRIQMSLHHLANLFLRLFHAAEIAEPLRWYIANDFD